MSPFGDDYARFSRSRLSTLLTGKCNVLIRLHLFRLARSSLYPA